MKTKKWELEIDELIIDGKLTILFKFITYKFQYINSILILIQKIK